MAVLGRVLLSSGERIDLADFLSIDSYTAGDLQQLLTGFVGQSTPYILQGFDVIQPQNAVGTQSCSINIANAGIFYPSSTTGPFYFGLPTATPLIPSLVQNATNYIYLTLTTTNAVEDTRAFWDPDANGGSGGEFTQEVNTESVIAAQVNSSVGSFPTGTVPLAIVVMGPVVITSIEDARPLMFRLGSGGISPNPYNTFAWPALPTTSYEREEPPNTIVSGGVNPFQGADKNIQTLKQWMDAIMSKLKELGGTTFWYEDASTLSLVTLFTDALETTVITKGQFIHSSSTPGLLTWTEDLKYELVGDDREYIVRAGNVTIPNGDVAYISLNRGQPFNSANQEVAWLNNQAYVNSIGGAIGLFANLAQGDYVKRPTDPDSYYLRVEQFYSAVNASGATTTAANAKSILLSGVYQGPTINDVGTYDQGVYSTSDSPADIIVSPRNSPAIAALGGNFSWLAFREDTIEGIGNVATTSLTLTNLATSTEDTALVTSSTAHGLSNGDYITISGTTNYNGTFKVEVENTTVFSIPLTGPFATETSGVGRYAIVTTVATTNGYGLQLESADHGFSTDDTIIIAGTTNYNGSFKIGVIDATHFQMGVSGAFATETAGTATLAKLFVRDEGGTIQVVQGSSVNPDGPYENIKLFIGMGSDSETSPQYAATISNTLEGEENFNTSYTENVTNRLSNLTAMMADRAQDKTIKYLPDNIQLVGNTTNGSAQQITFSSGSTPTLTILQPGSFGNAVITLPTTSPGISLLVNQSAYVSINRNASSTPSITVANTNAVPVDENVFVIASRLSDTNIYLWNGSVWSLGETPFSGSGTGIQQINLYDPVDTTLPTGSVTIDGVTVTAGMLVLFSNLASGNNEVYEANGTGSTISSWTAQYSFNGSVSPSGGSLVIVTQGSSFANQIGEFNGTTWLFNNTVRYFNGTDYWEQSALITSTLGDNTTNGTVFTVAYAGSEYMVIDYSVNRNSLIEAGTIHVATDGTNVSVTTSGATLNGVSGISFSGSIVGSNLELLYTSTSTGYAATMKYSVKRWSNSAGGPSGIPSYSGSSGTGVTSLNSLTGPVTLAAGSNVSITSSGSTLTIASTGGGGGTPGGPTESIQYNNGGTLAGSSEFLLDTANGVLNLNGLNQSILNGPITVFDNQSSANTLFTYVAATKPFAIIEYSVLKSGFYRVGRFLVANDGSTTSFSDDFVETNTTGVTLSASISGSNVTISYTSTSTGSSGTFKYSMRSWS